MTVHDILFLEDKKQFSTTETKKMPRKKSCYKET